MKERKTSIRIISQSFYPDIVATGELLHELAVKLSCGHGIEVDVLTAQPSFVKKERLTKKELCSGVKIRRLSISYFDKNKLTGKILNSWIFFFRALLNITFSRKVDWLLIPTSPPLLPFVGTFAKLIKRQKYIYLMHDVYPEIASKLGYIKHKGWVYYGWDILSKISLKFADKIIVLSDDMKEGLLGWVKDLDESKISVIHNWADEDNLKIISRENNHFLDEFRIRDKFIIEYSGNMGRIHEFDTILNAAKELKENKDILFLFIGAGGKKPYIKKFVEENYLDNVILLPYQNRENLEYSLGMADIHLLSLQEGYKHLAAPSKLYGILASGRPVAFVGESDCYIRKLLEENNCGFQVDIGNFKKLVQKIIEIKNSKDLQEILGKNSRQLFERSFTLDIITNKILKILNIKEEARFSVNKISLEDTEKDLLYKL